MGVPKLFRYLSRRYRKDSDIIVRIGNRKPFAYEGLIRQIQGRFSGKGMPGIDSLAIDMNSLFHNAYTIALRQNKLNRNKPNYVPISHIDAIIGEISAAVEAFKPRKVLILAVDGVPSVAKMQEQQRRRISSSLTRPDSDLLTPGPRTPLTEEFNKSLLLTPGTYYMEALDLEIKTWIEDTFQPKKRLTVVYMGHLQPGEGEHKILHFYRRKMILENPENGIHILYGADADLLFLGMMMYIQLNMTIVVSRDNFKLERSSGEIMSNTEYIISVSLVQTDMLADDFIASNIPPPDLIFMTMLMGNDFVPGVIEARNFDQFLDIMIEVYTQQMTDKPLIDESRGSINWENVLYFLQQLTYNSSRFLSALLARDQSSRYVNPQNPLLQVVENNSEFRKTYYHRCFRSPWSQVPSEYQAILNTVGLSDYFVPSTPNVADFAHHYFTIWKWAFDLYWGREESNVYAYPHWYPPMIVDLASYLKTIMDSGLNDTTFTSKVEDPEPADYVDYLIDETLTDAGFIDIYPIHVLFSVLPAQGKYLLPDEIMTSKLNDLWNKTRITNFRTDDFLATADYLVKLLLPPIPIRTIVGAINESMIITDSLFIRKQLEINLAIVRKAEREGRTVYQSDLTYRLFLQKYRKLYLTHAGEEIFKPRSRLGSDLVDPSIPLSARNTRLDPRLRKSMGRARDVERVIAQIQNRNRKRNILPGTNLPSNKGELTKIKITKIPLPPQTLKYPWNERHKNLPTIKLF